MSGHLSSLGIQIDPTSKLKLDEQKDYLDRLAETALPVTLLAMTVPCAEEDSRLMKRAVLLNAVKAAAFVGVMMSDDIEDPEKAKEMLVAAFEAYVGVFLTGVDATAPVKQKLALLTDSALEEYFSQKS